MKRIFALVAAVLLLGFTAVSVSAASAVHTVDGVKFSLSDSYTLLTEKDLLENSDVEGLLFAAISKDEAHQIQCRRTETAFSEQFGSFSDLRGEDLSPVGQRLFPDGYDTAEIGDFIYLKSATGADGQHTVMYVTVTEGKLYTFTYFGTDPLKMGEFMGTVTLPGASADSKPSVLIIVVLSLCIAGVAAALVLLILSFVKDYRHRKMEQNDNIVSQYIKIKRRKY